MDGPVIEHQQDRRLGAALATARGWLAADGDRSGIDAAPPPTATEPAPTRWGPRLGGALLVLAAILVPLARHRGRGAWLTVWAEDGDPFYQRALEGGPSQLTTSFAGYLSLPPRLLSALAVHVPIDSLPLYYALAGTTVTALLAAFAYRSSEHWIASRPVRLGLAAFLVLMPAAGDENTANGINTIWAFVAVLPWAVVSEQDRRGDVVVRAAVAFLAVTSSAAALVLAPLVIGWAVVRRTRATAVVAAAYAVGADLQVFVMVNAPDEVSPVPGSWSTSDAIDLVLGRVYATYLLGHQGARAVWLDHRMLGVVAALAVVAIGILVARGAGRRAQLLGGALAVTALVVFVATALPRGTGIFRLGGELVLFQHTRYSVVPAFLLASSLAVLAAPMGGRRGRATDHRWAGAFLVHLAVVVVACFPISGYRSDGPTWREGLDAGREACAALPPGATVEVAQDQQRFWVLELPCDRL